MAIVYVPRLIESAEQAEALPEGSIVPAEDKDGPWEKRSDGMFQGAGRTLVDACRVLDRIALVPIEAVEELQRTYATPASTFPGLSWPEQHDAWRRRLVTPWEEA